MILRIFILILIIIAIAFIAKWCLNKLSFFKSRKKLLYVLSGLIGLFSFIIYALCFSYYITKIPKENFSETTWMNEISERHKMIDDLLESDYFIGKNIDEIQKVFGKPKEVNSNKSILIYELIGHTALDFKITTLKLHVRDSIVKSFDFESKVD
ncbi:hypothetical protein ES692_14470 [Psychroserpens burtonensis]|uniref:Uncharacterized protein n=1 Tax=Psychroserpens burtonensis TaxID=49278 RepID=A0A5C7B5S8_9FLAO|nr:hypothetical protein [Psychroserpens burtonensis]TXE15957.1 hypothetical protein ES692_14470 [Psychroserpens burtonensis]